MGGGGGGRHRTRASFLMCVPAITTKSQRIMRQKHLEDYAKQGVLNRILLKRQELGLLLTESCTVWVS